MTDQKAAPHAAAAADTATAATVGGKDKHGLSCADPVGCGAAVAPDDGAEGGDGAVVLIGTSSGMLHCISCSSGQQLWKMHFSGSISTAAGFCPSGMVHAPSDAPADAGTDAFGDSRNHNSAAVHEQMQTDAKTDSQTDAQANCSLQHQQQSFPRQGTGKTQMAFDLLLVSCSNSGAVRVLGLPAVARPAVSLDQELLQSGQRAARPNAEVRQSCTPRTWAVAQMPGECMVC